VATAVLNELGPLSPVTGAGLLVPLVQGGKSRYVNLDYAASAPALQAVTDQVSELLPLYASVHRGAGYASQVCTGAYEAARKLVGEFAGARDEDTVIFTRNTTDAVNLLASAVPGGVVHLDIEHHANLLPWRRSCSARVVLAEPTVAATLQVVDAELARSPAALLAITGASNVTGEVLPLSAFAAVAHARGARIAVDGAQLVPHRRVSLRDTGIDYLAFSGHKMYAPFGAGVLVGRRDWLDAAPPYLAGGGAVRDVALSGTAWAASPARHEAGTPNVIGAVTLAAACRYLRSLPGDAVAAHESALLSSLVSGLTGAGARVLRLWADADDHVPVVTFCVDGYPAPLVASYLSAEHGIGVRDGRFCAHPLLSRFGLGRDSGGAVRASLGLGSRSDDVSRLVAAVSQLRADGPSWTYDDAGRPAPDPRPLPEWASAGPRDTADGTATGESACR
jgi:selenocysteine lyase/cysteine desulfurase